MSESYPYEIQSWRARCTKVTDGDTIWVFADRGKRDYSNMVLRLDGIDAPEKRGAEKELGMAAKDKMAELVKFGSEIEWPLRVEIVKEKPGSWARWIARIYTKDENGEEFCINDKMVELGHAEYAEYD